MSETKRRRTRTEMGSKSRAIKRGEVITGAGTQVVFIDNSKAVLEALADAEAKILTRIGLRAVSYAKKLCPVVTVESTGKKGYRGGSLRNDISFRVNATGDEKELEVGVTLLYGPYVELGTGPHFVPPPEWERFETEKGKGVGKAYVKPRPFIRPAIEDHVGEYQEITEKELRG